MSFADALKALYGFMSPARRRRFFLVLFLMVAGGFSEMAAIAALLPFVALVTTGAPPPGLEWVARGFAAVGAHSPQGQVLAAATIFILLAAAAGAARLLLSWTTQRFIFGLGHDLAVEVQRRVLHQPYSYHIERNSSDVLAALEKVDILVAAVLLQLMYAATSLVVALFILVALVSIDPVAAVLSVAGFGALYSLVSRIAARRLHRNSAISAAARGERLRLVQESLGGIRDVILDSSQPVYLGAFRRINERFVEAGASTAFIGGAPRAVIESAAMVVIAAVAVLLWTRHGGLAPSLPILAAMALGAFRLVPFMQQLYFSWTVVAGNRDCAAQVLQLLELPIEDVDGATERKPLPFRDRIRFENVTFRYPGAVRPALSEVTVAVPHGARVAVVGKTGSGKTTFADLLMGLLHPTAGHIEVDGLRLTGTRALAWRRSIAHVPQSIFLADTSIARNIAFGVAEEAIDPERVAAAARTAQLEEFVDGLPDGFSTRVGERGIRLSGGQRQRLGIARAIYKDAPVLVLDEATSALDMETEDAVLAALFDESARRRTIIMISHRETSLRRCDFVIRLHNGRASECAPAAEAVR